MDVQTSLPQHYEDPQEVSIEIQQRLEAKISKIVKLHSPVKMMFLEDTAPVHSHWQCDKMCSPVKPVIKLKASVHSNSEHFFLDSDQLCSSVKPTQLKEIIGWSPMASSKAEKMHSSVKPTIARGQHRFNQRYYFLSDSFFSNGSIELAVYIGTPNDFNSALSRLSRHYIHTLEVWEQQGA
jgi:hypothetical protein